MKPNDLVINNKNQKIYKILETGKLKLESGDWVDAFIYCPLNDTKYKYIRSIDNMQQKFTKIS